MIKQFGKIRLLVAAWEIPKEQLAKQQQKQNL